MDRPPFRIGEDHGGGFVGIALDLESSTVVHAVVSGAQRDEVGRVGRPAGRPVDDVVQIESAPDVAARNLTRVCISTEHDTPGSIGNRPLRASDRDRRARAGKDRFDAAVAGEEPADRVGESVTSVGGHGAIEVEVQIHAVPVAARGVGDGVE